MVPEVQPEGDTPFRRTAVGLSALREVEFYRTVVRAEDFIVNFSSRDGVLERIGNEEIVDTPSRIALTRLKAV